jgi:hypothetical protein
LAWLVRRPTARRIQALGQPLAAALSVVCVGSEESVAPVAEAPVVMSRRLLQVKQRRLLCAKGFRKLIRSECTSHALID